MVCSQDAQTPNRVTFENKRGSIFRCGKEILNKVEIRIKSSKVAEIIKEKRSCWRTSRHLCGRTITN